MSPSHAKQLILTGGHSMNEFMWFSVGVVAMFVITAMYLDEKYRDKL